jgi:hypothetical protein
MADDGLARGALQSMMESPAFSIDAPEFVPGGRVVEDGLRRRSQAGNRRLAKPAPTPPVNVVLDDMFDGDDDDDDELNFQFDEELEAEVGTFQPVTGCVFGLV